MSWLERNSTALQALAALITAAVALFALVGVKLQVDASYRVQREQSAKEIYRELLNISINNPDYVNPNYCELKKSPKFPAYEAFVDYILYTAEQVIDMDQEWAVSMQGHLEAHSDHLCSMEGDDDDSAAVEALLESFRQEHCTKQPAC